MNSRIIKLAGLHALGTSLYIALVASFLFHIPQIFEGSDTEKTVLIPIAMLLLFVFSATVTSSLVLGRPILWYMDGKKKEAVTLFTSTVAGLFIIMTAAFSILVLSK